MWAWVQGGALGILILGAAVVIWRLDARIERKDKESREDRKEYLERIERVSTEYMDSTRAATLAIEGMRVELATFVRTVAGVVKKEF